MPMYRPTTPASPGRLFTKAPPSPRARRMPSGVEEDLWSFTSNAPRTSPPESPVAVHSRSSSRDSSSRFKRRLQRWTRTSRDLDFGCAGDWSEGPADMGDAYYSRHPGGSNRTSTASSNDDTAARTHSRGPSTSSNWSVSTAASSMPPSPTLGCISELHPPPSPPTSRIPLTPRTAHRRRQSDELAGVDAVNEYFHRVRLSQIEEDDGSCASRCSSSTGTSRETPPSSTPHTRKASTTGLAIFGSSEEELEFGSGDFEVTAEAAPSKGDKHSLALHHSRSISHDLEIEFIETGHTTYTPLSVTLDDRFSPSTFILPEDAFAFPVSSPATTFVVMDTPSAASTFTAESAESCETVATGSTARATTRLHRRSPIAAQDMGPALDELSEYFSMGIPDLSSGSSTTSSSCSSGGSSLADLTKAPSSFAPASLLPPGPISPQRKHTPRFPSVSSCPSPRLVQLPPPTRHRRQSSSFAAAQRAKMAAAGYVSPTLSDKHVLYDWI
ncbi:hypothetical protein JCM10449v2_003263 [Rhodotorula kratochvilovae]